MKNKNIKTKFQSRLFRLFWFLCFLFSSIISAQLFVGENSIITDSENNLKKYSQKDSLKYTGEKGKIYIVKGTKIYNLKEGTTASIAYIPDSKKENTKNFVKNNLKKKDKPKIQEKKLPVAATKYKYTKNSDSHLAGGNISELKVISSTNNFQLKYILNSYKQVNLSFLFRLKQKITAYDHLLNSYKKNENFTVRPPPFSLI